MSNERRPRFLSARVHDPVAGVQLPLFLFSERERRRRLNTVYTINVSSILLKKKKKKKML